MKSVILFLLLFIPSTTNHDAVIAVFNLTEKNNELFLQVTFDVQDFLISQNLKENLVTNEKVFDYLNTTTQWKINDKTLKLKLKNFSKDNEHYQIECNLGKWNETIKTVAISNDFFTDINKHSNIIMLNLQNTFRDFRMHKDRKKITVSYK